MTIGAFKREKGNYDNNYCYDELRFVIDKAVDWSGIELEDASALVEVVASGVSKWSDVSAAIGEAKLRKSLHELLYKNLASVSKKYVKLG